MSVVRSLELDIVYLDGVYHGPGNISGADYFDVYWEVVKWMRERESQGGSVSLQTHTSVVR